MNDESGLVFRVRGTRLFVVKRAYPGSDVEEAERRFCARGTKDEDAARSLLGCAHGIEHGAALPNGEDFPRVRFARIVEEERLDNSRLEFADGISICLLEYLPSIRRDLCIKRCDDHLS